VPRIVRIATLLGPFLPGLLLLLLLCEDTEEALRQAPYLSNNYNDKRHSVCLFQVSPHNNKNKTVSLLHPSALVS
jgi:hypothetical protein